MISKMSYKDAGVDIKAGEAAVQSIKEKVRSTFTSAVMTDLGKFGGFFQLDLSRYKQPVLVSSIDGVGTKLKVAFMMDKHDTVGECLVNHCINDILVGGAEPLFFLDYIGTGVLEPHAVAALIDGMVRGCRNAGCALIGGEMAEMPGFYSKGEYDVAGSITGIVEKNQVIDGSQIQAGDVLIGLPSTGLHTNGYSLARKVLFEAAGYKADTYLDELGETVGEALLKVHRCYLNITQKVLSQFDITGMSHVTGGGIVGNTKRILSDGLRLKIQWDAWDVLPIFNLIQKHGHVDDEDMRSAFNLGIGYIYIVRQEVVDGLVAFLESEGEKPKILGAVEKL